MSDAVIVWPSRRSWFATITETCGPSDAARRWRVARSPPATRAVVIATTIAANHARKKRGERRTRILPKPEPGSGKRVGEATATYQEISAISAELSGGVRA